MEPTALATLAPSPVARSLVEAFLAGRSATTLRAYRQDLEAFRAWAMAGSVEDAARALLEGGHGQANGTALAWRASMTDAGLAPATVNRRLSALRSLVTLARTLGMVPWTLDVENVAAQSYRDTRGPGVDGVRALVRATEGTEPACIRNRALVRLLFDLALRRGEVVGLDVADVDLAGSRVAVLGKGRTQRAWLTLPAPTLAALRAWLDVRGMEPGPLFTSMSRSAKGHRLTGQGVAVVLADLSDAAGLAGEVRPHGLRHASITHALDATNGDVRAVQRHSRHRDVRTLAIYDDNRTDLGGRVASLVAFAV